jgi:hypothetical protein
MKTNSKLIGAIVVVLVILGGLWFYFGWYKAESQVIARCHKKYVQPQGDCYQARDDFYQCLKDQGGSKVFTETVVFSGTNRHSS